MAKQQKNWKFTPTGDFYQDLAMRESSGNSKISKTKYLGLYQFGEATLIDTGYYIKQKPKDIPYNNDWTGTWTGKNGIKSIDDFLHNSLVQEIAVREYHEIIWNRYLRDYQKHEGQTIGGINLTKTGMLAMAHLVGHTAVKDFISSNGKIIAKDGNGTLGTEYLIGFSKCNDNCSIVELQKQLEEQNIAKQQDQTTEGASELTSGNDYNEMPEYSGTLSMQKAANQSYRLMLQKRGLVDNSILQALDQSDKQIDAMAPAFNVMMQQAQNEMRKNIGMWQIKQNKTEDKFKNLGSFLLNMATQGHLSDSDTELNLAGNNEELD